MAIDKFKFISPGVFINEIDESNIPELPERMGPVLLGRFKKGPSNRPIKVSSYNELVAQFGTPAPGTATGDIWRSGAMTAPTYAAYAAQAWLRNNTPCTVVRMLGVQNDDAVAYSTNTTAPAGWRTSNVLAESGTVGGAYGLFVMPDPDSTGHGATTGSMSVVVTAGENVITTADPIRIGFPSDLPGGVNTLAAAPSKSQSLLFKFDNVLSDDSAANTVQIKGTAASDNAAIDAAYAMFARVINADPTLVEGTDFKAGTFDGTTCPTLAQVQAQLSASYTAATNTLTLHSVAAGNKANGITIYLDSKILVGDGGDEVVTLGVAAADGVSGGGTTATVTASTAAEVTGTLGAIFYLNDGFARLTGVARRDASGISTSMAEVFKSTDQKFTVTLDDSTAATNYASAEFNFDTTSDQFIRKVFNTDPTATNSELVDTAAGGVVQKYWLGETFEDSVKNEMKTTPLVTAGTFVSGTQVSASATGDFLGIILGLNRASGTSVDWAIRHGDAAAAQTGWFFSNDTRGSVTASFDPTNTAHTEKLFKLVALDNGENVNRDIKVSIADIKAPSNQFIKYGTFSVLIRDAKDTDANPIVLERYSNLTLDPVASNYIERVIGNKKYVWDDASKTVRQFGSYENKSKSVRVEVSPLVANGNAEGLLPYGVLGPVVQKGFRLANNGTTCGIAPDSILDEAGSALPSGSWVLGGVGAPHAAIAGGGNGTTSGLIGDGEDDVAWDVGHGLSPLSVAIKYPQVRLRDKSSDGDLTLQTSAYFGYQSNKKGTKIYSEENLDHLRGAPKSMNMFAESAGESEHCWVFTLDDIVVDASTEVATWTSGSRASGTSKTALSGSEKILDAGFNRFTSPVFGGKDGLDITEKDPFRNRYLAKGGSAVTNYAYNTIERNIDMIADPEFLEFDVAAVPGLTNETLSDKVITACETRGDAIAVIDLSGSYEPPHEGVDAGVDTSTRTGSVDNVVNNLKARGLNSSYGCAFFPFVQVRDTTSDAILFVPPSVVAVGTFSSSQRKSAVWFAPAGFTRGGLSEGSAGIPVIGTRTRVTAAQRDKLYDANINPIATFPAEGVVIFGQKTLQVTPSALDRINVRRLLIFLKKEISRIASTTLFEQNVQATWDKFKGQVDPFLASVKAGLGLTDYKVVLDSTTTTDDLVDRNILYAKIFLKPARAIEFIALDFIITRSGASFDD